MLVLFSTLQLNAQVKKEKKEQPKPLELNGISVQGDIASLANTVITNGERYSFEGSVQAELNHKFFPIFEAGFAGANKTSPIDINYSTTGLYGRLGVDFNLLKKKKDSKPTNNLFLAGLRLGVSNFNYNISNIAITDDYWGGTQIINYSNQTTTKIWFEIVAGIRVEVLKNIYMGWMVRNKNLISQDVTGQPAPWYIPGYGINNSSNWGVSYTIGYKF
jgi:hypothetical protein